MGAQVSEATIVMRKEIDRLRSALEKYSVHVGLCKKRSRDIDGRIMTTGYCTCGLDAALQGGSDGQKV